MSKFESEILNILKEIRKEVTETNQKLDAMELRVQNTEWKCEVLKKKVLEAEENISRLDREIRKRNLIFFGVSEKVNETENDVVKATLKTVENIEVQLNEGMIDFCRRLGKKKDNKESRPILIGLTTWRKKMDILANSKKLKGSEIWIREDFPPKIMEKRRKLRKHQVDARSKGLVAMMKYDKLVVGEEVYCIQDLEDEDGNSKVEFEDANTKKKRDRTQDSNNSNDLGTQNEKKQRRGSIEDPKKELPAPGGSSTPK